MAQEGAVTLGENKNLSPLIQELTIRYSEFVLLGSNGYWEYTELYGLVKKGKNSILIKAKQNRSDQSNHWDIQEFKRKHIFCYTCLRIAMGSLDIDSLNIKNNPNLDVPIMLIRGGAQFILICGEVGAGNELTEFELVEAYSPYIYESVYSTKSRKNFIAMFEELALITGHN